MSRWQSFFLVLIVSLMWFGGLGYRKLANPDEGRYAEIPREMVASGDWLTPRLNGIKYFEKPPLQYWITAVAYKTFGFHEWTARLWSALSGFFCLGLVWFGGRQLFGQRAGEYSVLALLTSGYFLMFGHINTLDMGLTLFTNLSLLGFLFSRQSDLSLRMRRAWMMVAWAGIALAILTKGLIGAVLPCLALIVYSCLQRDLSAWKNIYLVHGLTILLLIAAPWFIAVSIANPEFFQFFFIHEHLDRFTTTTHHRAGPVWYFLPILVLAWISWLGVIPGALMSAWKEPKSRVIHSERILLIWIAVVVGFFSLSGSKLPSYILPAMPAIALLLGRYLTLAPAHLIARRLTPFILATAAIIFIACEVMESHHQQSWAFNYYEGYSQWIEAAALVMGGVGLLYWRYCKKRVFSLIPFALSSLLAYQLIQFGFEELSLLQSGYRLAKIIQPYLKPETEVFSVGNYNQSLPPYLGRTVILVAYEDELSFGLYQEPQRWIADLADFESRWRQSNNAVAVLSIATYEQLRQRALPMEIIGRVTDVIVIKQVGT